MKLYNEKNNSEDIRERKKADCNERAPKAKEIKSWSISNEKESHYI